MLLLYDYSSYIILCCESRLYSVEQELFSSSSDASTQSKLLLSGNDSRLSTSMLWVLWVTCLCDIVRALGMIRPDWTEDWGGGPSFKESRPESVLQLLYYLHYRPYRVIIRTVNEWFIFKIVYYLRRRKFEGALSETKES